jgi:hypothetical protein
MESMVVRADIPTSSDAQNAGLGHDFLRRSVRVSMHFVRADAASAALLTGRRSGTMTEAMEELIVVEVDGEQENEGGW